MQELFGTRPVSINSSSIVLSGSLCALSLLRRMTNGLMLRNCQKFLSATLPVKKLLALHFKEIPRMSSKSCTSRCVLHKAVVVPLCMTLLQKK